jgi:hypothetical protein
VIDSGWGFGPLVGATSALAAAGVHVLAVQPWKEPSRHASHAVSQPAVL